MKKKIQSAHVGTKPLKGLKGIANSFVNVGIPVIVETKMETQYTGISAQLVRSGNKPGKVSPNHLTIKL